MCLIFANSETKKNHTVY
uniref:Uncharacterized protein n=1 Tax=Arundo donax TaxID=35708 RepID=A0A0A9BGJ2_ARUDO